MLQKQHTRSTRVSDRAFFGIVNRYVELDETFREVESIVARREIDQVVV